MEEYENKHEYDDEMHPNDIPPEQEKYEREEEIRKAYETIQAQKLALQYGWSVVCITEDNDPETVDTITVFSAEEPSDYVCRLAMIEDWGDYADRMKIQYKVRIVGHLAEDLIDKYGEDPIPF